MILFINGAFGVGKTSVANVLIERIPGAILYDPEEVGAMLRNVLSPIEKHHDFQDYQLWPKMSVEMARMIRTEYDRSLVIPMTVWNRERFEQVTDGLRDIDPDLSCFRLTAPEETLKHRILSRPDEEGSHEWCMAHLEVGLEASRDPAFGTEINTNGREPEEIADEILQIADRLKC